VTHDARLDRGPATLRCASFSSGDTVEIPLDDITGIERDAEAGGVMVQVRFGVYYWVRGELRDIIRGYCAALDDA
jgi:hypothetical protein